MRTIIRKTGDHLQPRRLEALPDDEFEKRIKDKTISLVGNDMYEEVDGSTYETKVMTPKKKETPPTKKKNNKKKNGAK